MPLRLPCGLWPLPQSEINNTIMPVNKNKTVPGRVRQDTPTHSRYLLEQGTQYESHTASTGARQPFHPVVVAAKSRTDQAMD
jgi:hypothetical protein